MVVAIIGVLCAIATPNLVKWLPRHRVGSAAREVMSSLDFARISAIKINNDVTVNFDFSNAGASLTVVDSGGTTLRTRRMPGDVDLADMGLGDQVTFNGHGFSTRAGRVIVQHTKNPTLFRSINLTIGGNASIQ